MIYYKVHHVDNVNKQNIIKDKFWRIIMHLLGKIRTSTLLMHDWHEDK